MRRLLQFKKIFLATILMFFVSLTFGQDGPSSYYKTNPTFGKRVSSAITIDGNPTEWSSDMLIVQGVANDDARAFRGSHEGPVYDLYQLYAAWDDNNLYIMWQLTNVSDIASPAQDFPHSDNGKPWNGDIPFQIAFDIDPSIGTNGILEGKTTTGDADSHVWGIYNVYPNNNVDKMLMFSSKPGVGQPAIFSPDPNSGSFNYNESNILSFNAAGVEYQWGDFSVPTEIYGIPKDGHSGYTVADLSDESAYVDFISLGHDTDMNTVYEMKIPLSSLGIDANYIENQGIGIMLVATFGQSGVDSLPFDETTKDNASAPYGPDDSTSAEKEDVDEFTAPFARIGVQGSGVPVVRPTVSVSPAGGKYIGGTEVTVTASGDNQPISIYYTLDGSTPNSSSTAIASGGTINITVNNTVLKVVAYDSEGTASTVSTNTYVTEEPVVPEVPETNGIKVSFIKPSDWANVNLWAWTATGDNVFSAWPGQPLTETDGWYSYSFDEAINSINVIFSNGGNPQTVDITNVTESTCFEFDGWSDGKMTVKKIDCPITTSIETGVANKIAVSPNPATNFITVNGLTVDNYSISIVSLYGQVLKSVAVSGESMVVDVSELTNGVYIIKISGKESDSIKFIKR